MSNTVTTPPNLRVEVASPERTLRIALSDGINAALKAHQYGLAARLLQVADDYALGELELSI